MERLKEAACVGSDKMTGLEREEAAVVEGGVPEDLAKASVDKRKIEFKAEGANPYCNLRLTISYVPARHGKARRCLCERAREVEEGQVVGYLCADALGCALRNDARCQYGFHKLKQRTEVMLNVMVSTCAGPTHEDHSWSLPVCNARQRYAHLACRPMTPA